VCGNWRQEHQPSSVAAAAAAAARSEKLCWFVFGACPPLSKLILHRHSCLFSAVSNVVRCRLFISWLSFPSLPFYPTSLLNRRPCSTAVRLVLILAGALFYATVTFSFF
jgi:hypothetical protein